MGEVLRKDHIAPERMSPYADVRVGAKRPVGYLHHYAKHVLVDEEVVDLAGHAEGQAVQECNQVEEERVAAKACVKTKAVITLSDLHVAAERYRGVFDDQLGVVLGLVLAVIRVSFRHDSLDARRLVVADLVRERGSESNIGLRVAVGVDEDLIARVVRELVGPGRRQRIHVQDQDRFVRIPGLLERINIGDVYARVSTWGHQTGGIKMVCHARPPCRPAGTGLFSATSVGVWSRSSP